MGGWQTLSLETGYQKRTEVQVYMSLYYDMQIWSTVVKEWNQVNIPNMDFSGSQPEILKNQVDPEDSHLFKDTKIPLFFKNSVAQQLYEAEEDEIKEKVWLKCEGNILIRTVYNLDEKEWLELVQEYQKYVAAPIRFSFSPFHTPHSPTFYLYSTLTCLGLPRLHHYLPPLPKYTDFKEPHNLSLWLKLNLKPLPLLTAGVPSNPPRAHQKGE